MSHSTGATIVIHCVDKRYSLPGIRQQLPEGYDVTVPGASLWLVHDPDWQINFFRQLQALKEVGVAPSEIIVVDHYDADGGHGCKAYGNDDSQERHLENLHEAAKDIASESNFQDVTVRLLLHDIDKGVVEEVQYNSPQYISGSLAQKIA